MIECFVFLKSQGDFSVSNPAERLHGAIVKILSKRLEIERIHGTSKINFCLSPIYNLFTNMCRDFRSNQIYFFRLSSLDNLIPEVLLSELCAFPKISLSNAEFEVIEAVSSKEFQMDDSSMDTLHFISPVTFRISKTENLPLPDPERIAKSLSKAIKKEVDIPPVKEFSIKSKAINFSNHVQIGCIGYLRFSKPLKELSFLHFTGLGYSTGRGLGSVLVSGIYSNEEKIEKLHQRFVEHEEKRYRS